MTPQQIDALERITRLRDAGTLSEAEFSAEKARILSINAPATAPVTKPQSKQSGCFTLLMYVFIAGVILSVGNSAVKSCHGSRPVTNAPVEQATSTPEPTPTTQSSSLGVGEIGYLPEACLAGSSEANFDEVVKLSVAKDRQGVAQMVEQGAAFVLDKGNRVRILESHFTYYRVRVLNGDNEGVSACVSREFVRRE